MTLIWLRAESRTTETRAPVVPADVPALRATGVDVVVERSRHRAFADDHYVAHGARLAPPGSWADAPADAFVLGLKELPPEPWALHHRHVYFGHAYKGQAGADGLLARFSAGGGELLDLEYLCDAAGRRMAAFGYWAGYVGAALAVLHAAGRLPSPLTALRRNRLDTLLTEAATEGTRAVVLGALGRCGTGARDALGFAGVQVTAWDVAQTAHLDRAALLDHDLLVNAVLTDQPGPALLAARHLKARKRLAVVADVTCDVGSPHHLLPFYDATTTWSAPVRRAAGVDVIAIDNLPALLPREASEAFSTDLHPHLPALADQDSVWRTARAAWRRATEKELTHAL